MGSDTISQVKSCLTPFSKASNSAAGQGGAPQTVRVYGKLPQRGHAAESGAAYPMCLWKKARLRSRASFAASAL